MLLKNNHIQCSPTSGVWFGEAGGTQSYSYLCEEGREAVSQILLLCDSFELRRHLYRLCLGPWTDHGERTGGFYACNRYESAKQDGVVRSLLY